MIQFSQTNFYVVIQNDYCILKFKIFLDVEGRNVHEEINLQKLL